MTRQSASWRWPLGLSLSCAACICLCSLLILLASCGGKTRDPVDQSQIPATKPAPARSKDQVHWTYEPKALELIIHSDPELNSHHGFAHATTVCIYQLTRPGPFQTKAAKQSGLKELLECNASGQSVVQAQRLFIQPGHNKTMHFARAEKARHVGLVAGYFQLRPDKVTRLYHIPLQNKKSGTLWWSKDNYTPGKLTMQVLLGPHSIQSVGERE
ncbi:MAG: type VI secretion system lipoprotein TssJ [Desulfovermiculus sp.]